MCLHHNREGNPSASVSYSLGTSDLLFIFKTVAYFLPNLNIAKPASSVMQTRRFQLEDELYIPACLQMENSLLIQEWISLSCEHLAKKGEIPLLWFWKCLSKVHELNDS